MNKLSKLVLDKIETIGLKEAALFFGKSEGAIRAWKNQPSRISAEAAERVMEEPSSVSTGAPVDVPPDTPPPKPSNHDQEHEGIWNNLELLNKRLMEVENVIRGGSGLPPKITEVKRSETVPPAPVVAPGQPVTAPGAVPPPVGSQPYVPSTGQPGAWLAPHTWARRGV